MATPTACASSSAPTKQAQQLADAHSRVTLVPRSGKGKNALDFHLSFYLGYVAAKHPDAHLVVVANDKGYDPMIAHARMLKFTVKRVGHKARAPAPVKLPAKTLAKPANNPVTPAGGKKPATTAKATPAKKAAPTNKAPAKKVSPPKAPTKKAPVKKVAKPTLPTTTVPAQPKAAVPAESMDFNRVGKALAKMGAERPTKLKSFLRHVKAMLGQDSTAEQIDAVVHKLEQAKVVRIAGEVVSYGR
jgi:hypothetical protein